MAVVWHTRLTACQHPPARNAHTTEAYGGGGRGFLSLEHVSVVLFN